MDSHIAKLPNAPLQEVIFELRWKLAVSAGLLVDKDVSLASGSFLELAREKFKHYNSLKALVIPDDLFINKVIHQYWKNKNEYPVMQLGAGIFSVNDTEKKYIWEEYKKCIFEGIGWLQKSYRSPIQPNFIELRYIDSVAVGSSEAKEIIKFISQHLNFKIEHSVPLLNSYELDGFQFAQKFKVGRESYLDLFINNGIRNIDQASVVLWQISVSREGDILLDDINEWIEFAHEICSPLFKKMISQELYERFKTN